MGKRIEMLFGGEFTQTQRERERNYILQIPSRRGRGRKGKRKENQKIILKSKNLLTSWGFRLAPPLMRREAHVNFPFQAA